MRTRRCSLATIVPIDATTGRVGSVSKQDPVKRPLRLRLPGILTYDARLTNAFTLGVVNVQADIGAG